MKNRTFVFVCALVAVAIIICFKFFSRSPVEQTTAPAGQSEKAQFSRPHSPSFGPQLARVTVTEWFDPECESCRMIHPGVKKLIKEYGDRVHFVLRYMPYHPDSLYAASALQEAKELGKFDEALDVLFRTQPEWGNHEKPNPSLISQNLSKLGIPPEKLKKEYLIQKHESAIRLDETDGNLAGVRGTPTFFVDGQIVYDLDEKALRDAIESSLNRSR